MGTLSSAFCHGARGTAIEPVVLVSGSQAAASSPSFFCRSLLRPPPENAAIPESRGRDERWCCLTANTLECEMERGEELMPAICACLCSSALLCQTLLRVGDFTPDDQVGRRDERQRRF